MRDSKALYKSKVFAFVAFTTLLFAFAPHTGAAAPFDEYDLLTDLPTIEDLYCVIIKDNDAQLLALEGGKVDMLGDIARISDIRRLSDNEEIDLYLAEGFHAFFLGLNLRKPPWDRVELRRSIWEVLNRKQIVRDVFGGYALPLFSFLPPASSYQAESPLGESNLEKARERLEKSGWRWSKKGVLIYPGQTKAIPRMKLMTPTAQVAPTTAEIAERICESMRGLGIPIETEPMDFSMMVSRLDRRDFDAYVIAWGLSRDPDSLYAFYHSSMDIEGGYNISGIKMPDLDEALEALKSAKDENEARAAAREAQKLLYEYVPQVPIYSRYYVTALQSNWENAVTSKYTTPDNVYSFLSLKHREGRKNFYWCLPEEPRNLNPLSAGSAYDWQVLSLIYESLLGTDPFTLEDIPWLAKSWRIETTDDGRERTRLFFVVREDIKWHDGKPFTAEDVKATIAFMRRHSIPRYYDNIKDIEDIKTQGNLVVITFSQRSFWYLHQIGGLPILPAHVLCNTEDWRSLSPDKLIGTGPFQFASYKPGEYVKLLKNNNYWRRAVR
ncbi:ABC transporter substrate-binding protein [Acetomicrobium hydrogeniformans]|uniref:Solute-binding protein family 5 domain-containing protein n=1 Tax=Acetomicrobium hydrogeniformans ATCC BAA-1850 TaxID=592015 RepID=A0A0T5XAM9_9BACT|nr:ABC transporter substrate-binding protein [Acetomicrobium hydrogeniformans]KRT35393.1 hypothetical protein HMPREF1705_02619 [Acetomicrobium hydrogeniformans ATCC BAA-1850]